MSNIILDYTLSEKLLHELSNITRERVKMGKQERKVRSEQFLIAMNENWINKLMNIMKARIEIIEQEQVFESKNFT